MIDKTLFPLNMSYMTKTRLTRKQTELLAQAERQEPVTIYQLAKDIGRPYRRVHDNVQKFAEMELVRLEKTKVKNRDATWVISNGIHYQRLLRLNDMESLGVKGLVGVAQKLTKVLEPYGVVIGGICGAMHGIERFVCDVDMATDLKPEKVVELLKQRGIEAKILTGDVFEPLPWVILGECDGIRFQVLSAKNKGVQLDDVLEKLGMRIASVNDFITSKCMSGGQQDMYDVAVLILQDRELEMFAMQQAGSHGSQEKLITWLADEQLKTNYSS